MLVGKGVDPADAGEIGICLIKSSNAINKLDVDQFQM
jgi:hypothetical protein